MRLATDHNDIIADAPHAKHREAIRPERAAAVLASQGLRPAVAAMIAHGDLSTPTGARRVARQAGLIKVETSDARMKGLIQ